MHYYPSRLEQRQEKFYMSAENREISLEQILYPSEVKRLQKNGFSVEKIRDFDKSKCLSVYHVSWANAFKNGIPYLVFSYINGVIYTYPREKINNLAQELYVISHRV